MSSLSLPSRRLFPLVLPSAPPAVAAPPVVPPALVDADAACAYLGGVSQSWLRDRDRDGTLRAVRLGRLRRWRVVDLDAYVARLAGEKT